MNYRDKIRMWLKENKWKDGDLAKAAGHHSGKIADLLNGKHGQTIRAAMGIEHAKSTAGHSSTKTTAIYIDPAVKDAPDREAARAAALAMG